MQANRIIFFLPSVHHYKPCGDCKMSVAQAYLRQLGIHRISISNALLYTDTNHRLVHNVSTSLFIYPNVISKNIGENLPLMAGESIIMADACTGSDYLHLHEAICRRSLAAGAWSKVKGFSNDILIRYQTTKCRITCNNRWMSYLIQRNVFAKLENRLPKSISVRTHVLLHLHFLLS